MAVPILVKDEVTTNAMIVAFDKCQDECAVIAQTVATAEVEIGIHWGGVAANEYRNAMRNWMDGFTKVQQGLNMLNASMAEYAKITDIADDEALQAGSGWALPPVAGQPRVGATTFTTGR
ncbi:WXG100 family type VII secretion target [Parafrankia elaeagni]|uniref:hypothetical protein n=1 Tax=Parafrankia elaeagni TaxID=222534 RepID=UPI0003654B69|nr:hypothetical protein [Parafrankia elaeagni]